MTIYDDVFFLPHWCSLTTRETLPNFDKLGGLIQWNKKNCKFNKVHRPPSKINMAPEKETFPKRNSSPNHGISGASC